MHFTLVFVVLSFLSKTKFGNKDSSKNYDAVET